MPVEDGEWHKKEAEKLELPVLCEIDGKEVLRFSELFGVREPYWAIGGRKLRQKRSFLKGNLCLFVPFFISPCQWIFRQITSHV